MPDSAQPPRSHHSQPVHQISSREISECETDALNLRQDPFQLGSQLTAGLHQCPRSAIDRGVGALLGNVAEGSDDGEFRWLAIRVWARCEEGREGQLVYKETEFRREGEEMGHVVGFVKLLVGD